MTAVRQTVEAARQTAVLLLRHRLVRVLAVLALLVAVLAVFVPDRLARRLTGDDLYGIVVYLVVFPLILWLPSPKPDVIGEVAHQTFRLFLAGEIAPLVTNLLIDIPIFAALKKREIPLGFFGRTNLSNLASMTIGTVLFMTLAFFGVRDIGPMIIVGIVWRFGFTLLVSPFTSLVVGVVRRGTSDRQGKAAA